VTSLSEALERVLDQFPIWRGQNEQSMALVAVDYGKAKLRRQMMITTSSNGPGATNMITTAGFAHVNRLQLFLIACDLFSSRHPEPVLQQTEHYNSPIISVKDSFKVVTRYWDRIFHPNKLYRLYPKPQKKLIQHSPNGLSQNSAGKVIIVPA
jgi:3D-(3,5/4)-trihydroxycyclohexane-1,2-dione acylhydrolase (decyclizing)